MARRGLAPNWVHLEGGDLEATILLMNDAEVNLARAPDSEILMELVAAGAGNADEVLALRADHIVEQLRIVIDEVRDPALTAAADEAREALDAHAAGLPKAAQALATVVVGSTVHDVCGLQKIVDAHNTYKKLDPEKAEFYEFRNAAIYRCLGAACAGNNAPGTNFRRNRSAHRVDPAQYTPANAVRALLLIAGLLREQQFWIDEAATDQAAA
jgi:hypothetical protein